MIKQVVIFLLTVLPAIANGECENGWTAYKDELCIRTINTLQTYDDAKEYCQSQGDGNNKASLVMVKDVEFQNFLTNYTLATFDYIWLGGRYDNGSSQFKWEDGEAIVYSNWMSNYPENKTSSDACIELRLSKVKRAIKTPEKWGHESCSKLNLAMCQRPHSWSLRDAEREIMNLRMQQDADRKQQAEDRKRLEEVSNRVVPVGSIYIEYHNQPSPPTLWPTLTWQDITNVYAGLFFRAEGGDSASWGTTQTECAPRITQMQLEKKSYHNKYSYSVELPASGWSAYGNAGEHWWPGSYITYEGMRFYTEGCEVRPQNKAIRIWKRTE